MVCAAESAELGLYVAFSVLFDGVNVPLPLVVHTPVVVPPDTEPFSEVTMFDAHTVWSAPALTTGAGVMVTTKLSTAMLQLFAVRNSVAPPFAISKPLGTYVALSTDEDGVKTPVPVLPHVPVVAPPATTPFSVTAALLPQTVTSFPAAAVPAGRM